MNQILNRIYTSFLSRRVLWILVTCSLLAASTGPFGTYETQSFGQRLFYWSSVVVVSTAFGQALNCLAHRLIGDRRPGLQVLVTAILVTLCFTPFLWVFTVYVTPGEPGTDPSFLTMLKYVVIIALAVCVLRLVMPDLSRIGVNHLEPAGPEPKILQNPTPRLFRRLPSDAKAPVLRLTVRDHFVDVVTATDIYTIRMRFADAIAEMDPVVGYCTHRSHWVACDAIAEIERDNGRIQVRLVNGDRVPVSRKYRSELERADQL